MALPTRSSISVSRLKELGCNALRCRTMRRLAELLDVADRLGLLVMDENRLFNPSPDYVAMLEWMVRRDRNHPSVILWSVFNEEPLQGTREGYEMVRRMVEAVKELDDTRPVTAAMNGGMDQPTSVADAVDVSASTTASRSTTNTMPPIPTSR